MSNCKYKEYCGRKEDCEYENCADRINKRIESYTFLIKKLVAEIEPPLDPLPANNKI